jgi:hypothetical protein
MSHEISKKKDQYHLILGNVGGSAFSLTMLARIWDGMHVRKIVCNVMNICSLVRNDDTHCSDPRVVYNVVAKQREVNTLRSV